MRLIDADKAKAELLRIARDIHDCCGFYDGLKAGYQSAADRLDTIPTAEKECDKGHWIDITFDASMCSVCQTTQEYETKGRPKTLNLLCDRKNKSAGNVSNCETRSGREQRRTLSKKRVVKEYSRRFNVWEVARGLNKTKHPAVFPERLANDHILSWSNKGDVVLDPFCGSGTTAI